MAFLTDMVLRKYIPKPGVSQVVVPEGITRIGECAFKGCTELESVIVPEGVTRIGYLAFKDCINLKTIKLPGSVEEIQAFAFENCKSLSEIALPCRLGSIEQGAFWGCESLRSIEIPDSVKQIGHFLDLWFDTVGAFEDCKNLKEIKLGLDSNFVIYEGALWTKDMSQKLFELALK